MDREMYNALAAVGQDEAKHLLQHLGKIIEIDHNARFMLARVAIHMADGEGYMRSRARVLVDHMIQLDPEANGYRYEYEPPDADARRRAGHVPPNITFL